MDTLLQTKLYIPLRRSAQSTVPRPRLLHKLDEGLECRLVLVSAPAGFGKTTLVSEWLASLGTRVQAAWLSLDEHDNDLVRFWRYVIAALQTAQADLGQAAQAMLSATPPAPIEAVLTALINDAAARLPSYVLVLDDYYAIKYTLSTPPCRF